MENRQYSILIIGMFGIPSHLSRFIRNLKQTNTSVNITLYSDRKQEEFSQDINNYIDEYIQQKKYTGWPKKLWKFRKYFDRYVFVKQIKELSMTHHYDIVNIHFPTYFMSYVMVYFKKMCDTVIVSPWGSDVLRVEDSKKKKILSRVFMNSDFITTRADGNVGKALIQEMKIDESKFHATGWGSETIDYINSHISEVSSEQAKEQLNLSGRYLITCGYNAFEEQKHEIIINAIYSKRMYLPENMTLMFPVTYGTSYGTKKQKYVERLKKRCKELNLSVVFYENYLSVEELFLLRRATDMFIHVQTTDAGNSSLQEYVLCGAKVVHGSWVHYNNLEKYEPLFYYPVKDLEHLGETIVDAYNAPPIQTPKQVIEFIQNRGWKAKMKLWNDFFVSCCK